MNSALDLTFGNPLDMLVFGGAGVLLGLAVEYGRDVILRWWSTRQQRAEHRPGVFRRAAAETPLDSHAPARR